MKRLGKHPPRKHSKSPQTAKIVIKTFIYILTLLNLVNNAKPESCCKQCLTQLKDNPWYTVKTFQAPKKANYTGFCGKSFTKLGSCCNQQDAVQYTRNWLRSVKQRTNITLNITSKFRSSLEFLDHIDKYLSTHKAQLTSSKASKILKPKELEDFKLQLKNYIESIHDFKEKENRYIKAVPGCFKRLTTLRANAVCLLCSGTAQKYLEAKYGRLKVQKRVCRPLIKDCIRVFAYQAEAVTFFHRMAQIRRIAGGALTTGTRAKGMLLKDLNMFRVCASDPEGCIKRKDLLYHNCKAVALGEVNPEVEGEFDTYNDGYRAVLQLAMGKDIGKGRRRALGSDATAGVGKASNQALKEFYAFLLPDNKGADISYEFNSTAVVVGNFSKREAVVIGGGQSPLVLGLFFWVWMIVSFVGN